LVDDGLVDKEKISGANYYWSFPAKKDRLLQIQYEKTLANIELLEREIIDANTALIEAQRGREDDDDHIHNEAEKKCDVEKSYPAVTQKVGDDDVGEKDIDATNDKDASKESDEPLQKKARVMSRQEKLQRLQEIQQFKNAALVELEKLKENDPQAMADLQQELNFVRQAANRWTDNIYNCQSYLIKKRGMNKKEANKIIGITDTFDCTFTPNVTCRYLCIF
jgi:Leucine zipper with capping helix domain/Mnd1 HTH domain